MKKNYKKIIILVLLLINCIGLYKICSAKPKNNLISNNIQSKDRIEKIKEKGVLTILTSDLAPFSFIDTNTNEPTGIDIDILKEIAKELGVNKVEVKVVPFSNLLDTLNTDDSVDVAARGIIITDKRKELVNFTDPIYKESEAVILPKVSRINFKEDLKDAVIGAQKGSVYMDLAERWKKEGNVKDVISFDKTSELLSAIKSQKIDAGVMDSIVAEYILFTQNPYLRIMEPYKPDSPGTIGIAVRKSDVNLLNTINKKINDMKRFKAINKILEKYGLSPKHIIFPVYSYSNKQVSKSFH